MTYHFHDEETIDTLVSQFQHRTLPLKEWTHEAHLTVGLWYLKNYPLPEATCLIRGGIITYNLASGGENTPWHGYHETLTLLWIKIIEDFVLKNEDMSLLELCNAFFASPYAARNFPLQFYKEETLMSTQARAFWVEPDKAPFSF
jgi:hypothetical protein